MKKTAASSAQTSKKDVSAGKQTTDINDVEKALLVAVAKRQFLGATMNMGLRLAITVVIPIVAGVKLDQWLDSSPNFTLLGFIIAAVAGSVAVWSTIKEVNMLQAEEEKSALERRNIKRD